MMPERPTRSQWRSTSFALKLRLGREIQDRDVGIEIGAEQVVGEGPRKHLDRVVPLPPRDLVVEQAHRVLVPTVRTIDAMGGR